MGTYSWGLTLTLSLVQQEVKGSYVVRTSQGGARTSIIDLTTWGSFSYRAFVGYSVGTGWFSQLCLTVVT